MRALAVLCLLAALGLGVREVRGVSRSRRGPAVRRRMLAWYERSRAGRRLAAKLWSAQIGMSPASWRFAQLLVAAPVVAVLVAAGMALPAAVTAASTLTRLGGALLLRVRRGAAAAALDDSAPVLARALATELSAWGSGGQAITAACARCEGRAPVAVSRVLQGAAARVVLGGDASSSLHRALRDAAGRPPPESAIARVAAVFALHRQDAAATAAALERLAAALEDDAAAHREASAAVAEVRMSAVAVPLIAGATLVMLLASDPPALAAATSMPLCALLGVAVIVVVAAAVGARRLVST